MHGCRDPSSRPSATHGLQTNRWLTKWLKARSYYRSTGISCGPACCVPFITLQFQIAHDSLFIFMPASIALLAVHPKRPTSASSVARPPGQEGSEEQAYDATPSPSAPVPSSDSVQGRLLPRAEEAMVSSASAEDDDLIFVAKLVILSFVGGAVVKYGSLLSPVAFSADPVLATMLVLSPPTVYAIMLLTRGKK
jgi:hypothetical protein